METRDRDAWMQQVLHGHTPDGAEVRPVYLRCRAGTSSRASFQGARTDALEPAQLTPGLVEAFVQRCERDPWLPAMRYIEAVRTGETSTGGGVYTDTLVVEGAADPVTAPLTVPRVPAVVQGGGAGDVSGAVLAATVRDLALATAQGSASAQERLLGTVKDLAGRVQELSLQVATAQAAAARQVGYTEGRQTGYAEGRQAGEDEAMDAVASIVQLVGGGESGTEPGAPGAGGFDLSAALAFLVEHAGPLGPALMEQLGPLLMQVLAGMPSPTPSPATPPAPAPEPHPAATEAEVIEPEAGPA